MELRARSFRFAQSIELRLSQRDISGREVFLQLLDRTRPYDRSGNIWMMQLPRERNLSWRRINLISDRPEHIERRKILVSQIPLCEPLVFRRR